MKAKQETGARKEEQIPYAVGSGNVFADLDLDDADERLTRAQLGHTVHMILAKKSSSSMRLPRCLVSTRPKSLN